LGHNQIVRIQVKLERREINYPKPLLEYHTGIKAQVRICYQLVKPCPFDIGPGFATKNQSILEK
jgi:hypothetical protein